MYPTQRQDVRHHVMLYVITKSNRSLISFKWNDLCKCITIPEFMEALTNRCSQILHLFKHNFFNCIFQFTLHCVCSLSVHLFISSARHSITGDFCYPRLSLSCACSLRYLSIWMNFDIAICSPVWSQIYYFFSKIELASSYVCMRLYGNVCMYRGVQMSESGSEDFTNNHFCNLTLMHCDH